MQMTESRGQTIDGGKAQSTSVILTVPSQPKYLYVVRSALYPLIIDAGFGKKDARRIVLAVDEACSNIIKHAYGGDPAKTITVTVEDRGDRFTVMLRDLGRKADPAAIAPRDLADVRPGGLGSHFMKMAFDTVSYDTSQGEGTLLTLVKRKQQVNA
jgi:anti-sigma regulatory factor (Ser/Thr protein kinase)